MPISQEELDAWDAEADRKIQLEQIEKGITPEQFAQEERAKWRWSGSFPRGLWLTASDLAADFNTGITSLLGDDVQDAIASIGIGRSSKEIPRMGIAGAGAETAGQAMTMAAGAGALLSREAAIVSSKLLPTDLNPSMLRRVGADLMETIQRFPKAFLGAEGTGGMGAGMATEAAKQAGAPPEALPYIGLAGGAAGGVSPVVGANFTRKALNWSLSHVTPWLDKGKTLAAVRLQALAREPQVAANKVLAAPEGVPPGRASEDPNLMALEGRLLEDDPAMAAEFDAHLQKARQIAQQELRDMHGNLRQPGEWERSVIEKVAAPGATISPNADPQQMLRQARKSFAPVYNDFSGFPVKPHIETEAGEIPLDQVFKMSVQDEDVLASDSERKVAAKILQDEFSRIKPAADKDPTIDSSKLLFVRQMLRDKISDLTAKRQRGSHITARILSNAEASITKIFEQQLPDEALQSLTQIDDQYKLYRIVEQAVTTAGDKQLSPEALAQAVRQLAPRGAQDLRKAARAGRNIESVLNDTRAAKLMVQGQPGNVRQQVQSDFFHHIWERSLTKELDDGDAPFVSGERYFQHLVKYKETANALGIPKEEYNRALEIAKTIRMMEAKSPQALKESLESGPGTILQLMASVVGAKWGSHMAQLTGSKGGSLVLANFGSQRARRLLAMVHRDDATDVLIDATKNRELYAALLTKRTASVREQERAARVIAAWAGATFDPEEEGGGGGR